MISSASRRSKRNKENVSRVEEKEEIDHSESMQLLLLSAKTKDVVLFNKHSSNVPNAIHKFTEDGKALIHWAAVSGSAGVLVELIHMGANVDLQDAKGVFQPAN